MKHKDNNKSGFTLIETCIVLIIASLFLGTFLSLHSVYRQNSELEDVKKTIVEIDEAMSLYYSLYGSLPCPANLNAIDSSHPEFGASLNCDLIVSTTPSSYHSIGRDGRAVITGLLPTRALNLPDSVAKTIWNAPIYYALTKELSNVTTFRQELGSIYVDDEYGKSVIFPAGSAQYALIMHGFDGIEVGNIGCVDQLDSENCDADSTFVVSDFKDGGEHYDDILHYRTFTPDQDSQDGQCDVYENLVNLHNGSVSRLTTIDTNQALKIDRGDSTLICNPYILSILNETNCVIARCDANLQVSFGNTIN